MTEFLRSARGTKPPGFVPRLGNHADFPTPRGHPKDMHLPRSHPLAPSEPTWMFKPFGRGRSPHTPNPLVLLPVFVYDTRFDGLF